MRSIHRYLDFRRQYQLYLMLFLPLAYLIIFHYIPMYGAQIAFRNFRAIDGISGSPWVGMKNILRFVRSYQFERVVGNTIIISAYTLVVGFPIPIFLALLIHSSRNLRMKKSAQMITYAPHFISTVVMVGILQNALSVRNGWINNLIGLLGGTPLMFMGESSMFSSIYVISEIWQHAGWESIIYVAALSAVDPGQHEAAIVDGATRIQRLWFVDLPTILPTIVIMLILRVGRIMSIGFEKIFLMQNPMNISASEVISTFVYKQAFAAGGVGGGVPDFSYGAAIGLFNALINFILLLSVNATAKKISRTSLW